MVSFFHSSFLLYERLLTCSRLGTLTTIKEDLPSTEIVPTEAPTWVEYYRVLAQALAGESELPASGTVASQVIRLIELIKESSKQGRTLDV